MVKELRDKGYKVEGPPRIFILKKSYKNASKPEYQLRTTVRGVGIHVNLCDKLEVAKIDPNSLNWEEVKK